MRIPNSRASESIRQIIRLRGQCYEITRQTGVENIGMGETRQTTDTIYVDALLYAPSEGTEMNEFGDRLTGDLNGLATPDADVEVGDEYQHGGATYEVQTVDNNPSGTDRQVLRFALDRVTGER